MNKKGEFELGGLQGLIITVVIIGILLGIGFLVLEEFQEETWKTTTETMEEPGNLSGYSYSFVNNYGLNGTLVVTNESNAYEVGSGNYTITSTTDGYLTAIALTSAGNTTYGFCFGGDGQPGGCNNLTLSFTYEPGSSRSIGETIDAMQNIPTWLGLIIILFIVGILLAIVFTVFPQYGGSPSV